MMNKIPITRKLGAQKLHKQKLWRDRPDLTQEQVDYFYKRALKEVGEIKWKSIGNKFRQIIAEAKVYLE